MSHTPTQQRRIRMLENAKPEVIITPDNHVLGTFLPGLSYRETPQNAHIVAKVISDGRAVWVKPEDGVLNASSSRVSGRMET